MCNIQNQGNEYQCRQQHEKFNNYQIIIDCVSRLTSESDLMHRFKPNQMSEPNSTSSLLLNHIKDQQFYSTISTITLQLAKEAGADKKALQELYTCFQKVKGSSNQPMLTYEEQNNLNHQNINKHFPEQYEPFEKDISFKQQINFLAKMENQLVQSRQKQAYTKSINKYAAQKYSQLLPLFNIEAPTKGNRFKSLLSRNKRSKVCTNENYFKLNALDLLKNVYQNSNECYTMMRSFTLLKTMFGHSMDDDRESNCPLYNVLFDQSQNLIISGGQQGAIKIWSKQTGLLLSSLKGHQEYINKLQVTKCNRYICSSAGDGIRFFLLRDMTTLGGWKAESIIDITSIYDQKAKLNRFMFGDKKNIYLLDQGKMLASRQGTLTKQDFSIYTYAHNMPKQSHILMIQINDDQTFVLLGFETGDIILFHYKDLFTADPIKNQSQPSTNCFNLSVRHHLRVHQDEIRQLKWHKNNQNFVSGGKQGYCLLWEYKNQKVPTILKQIRVSKLFNRRKKRAFGCNFICFNCTYSHFIAGFMELVDEDDEDRGNGDVIAYSLQQKQIIFEFSKDMPIKVASVRGMDTHPTYPNVAVICEGTGRILVIDFLLKTILNTFELKGFHLLYPYFSLNPGDCRFSKDGKYFVVSTQFGSVSIFGYDIQNFYETCPTEQFFSTDFTAFTVNQKMQPIPIQGDLQMDMNRVQRGQIRNIRGNSYQKQLKNNFQQYWDSFVESTTAEPIDHRNTLMIKDNSSADSQDYAYFLNKIKFNLSQAQKFNSFYRKNLEEIEGIKQSLLYDQRQKQSKVFKKIIQQKLRKLRGDAMNGLPQLQLTHDLILEQIDAKGRRGGRKLVKVANRQNLPNYKDDNFDYDSRNQQDYNIQEDNPEQQDLNQLDCDVSGSQDQIPRTTRRQNNHTRRFPNRNREAQTRYNIRSRPSQNYNYDQNQEQEQEYEQKKQRNLKRKSPAQDIQEMLKDDEFRNYDMSKGRKKRKRNRMQDEEEDQDFIKNQQDQSEYGEQSSDSHRHRRDDDSNQRRRGRSRKGPIAQAQVEEQESIQHYSRLRKKQQKVGNQNLQNDYKIEQGNNAHNLRARHQSSNAKSSSKKKKEKDLGQCSRCAVNPAVVICNICECACCQSCKNRRGKQFGQDKFTCFVCMYVNFSGTAIVQQKKLSEQYLRLNERSQQVYVPQVEDLVRFFFQGYEQFLAHNIRNLNIEPIGGIEDYLLMPHIYDQIYGQTLLKTPLCRVKDTRYFFPFTTADTLSTMYKRRVNTTQKKHIQMLINLEIVLDQTQFKQLERTDFWVFFIPGPISIDSDNQFLLREQQYRYLEQNNVLESLTQNQTVYIYGEEYQIIQIGAAQNCFPQSIWRQVKVSRSDSKRLRNMSKESQKLCNVWNLNQLIPQIQYKHDYKPEQYQDKILDKIKHIRQHQSQHAIYDDYVEFVIVTTYRKIVQVGICLNSIQQRVRNNYYRSLNGLQFDLDHMIKNSITFNGKDTQVTSIGIYIRKQILKVLNVSEQQLRKFNTKQEIQPSRKQKEKRNSKKKESEQLLSNEDSPIINVHAIRSLRNTRTRNAELTQKKPQNDTTQKKPQNDRNRRKIQEQSDFNASQSQFHDQEKNQIDEQVSQELNYSNKNKQRISQRHSKSKHSSKVEKISRSKNYEKINEDYDKQEQVYKNIQNRRNRSRFLDSSHESNEKNPATAGCATRRSGRLHN